MKDGESMTYILKKHKNTLFLTLILALSFGAWYMFINKNINKIPEKADLVFRSTTISRSI